MPTYTTSLEGITPAMLRGFFAGWRSPLTPEKHLRVLSGSRHVVLALSDDRSQVIGFINAISDGEHSAFIPLLEVLPEHRRSGIGRELVRRMLEVLKEYPCIDLTCDPGVQTFYEKCGLQRSVGMVIRAYGRSGPKT